MDKTNFKFQIFTALCMSNSTFTPTELREATTTMFDYITEGFQFEEKSSGTVTNLTEVH